MIFHSDFLILGSGVAGLTTAIKLAKHYPDKKISTDGGRGCTGTFA